MGFYLNRSLLERERYAPYTNLLSASFNVDVGCSRNTTGSIHLPANWWTAKYAHARVWCTFPVHRDACCYVAIHADGSAKATHVGHFFWDGGIGGKQTRACFGSFAWIVVVVEANATFSVSLFFCILYTIFSTFCLPLYDALRASHTHTQTERSNSSTTDDVTKQNALHSS